MISRYSYKLTIIFMALGAIVISQSYLAGYKGEFNYTLFWIGILLALIPTLAFILNTDSQIKILVSLILFGFVLYLPLIFWSPTYFRFNDEILHLNSLELMLEKGSLDIYPVHGISKYYPGFEFLTIFFMKFTGLPVFIAAKVLMGIIHSLILVFLYFTFKIITSSQKIAALGSVIYAGNPGYIFFDALFSYETLGILFMISLMYIIFRRTLSNNEKFSLRFSLTLISVIMLFTLVVTHHFSSYMFSFFLIFVFVSYIVYGTEIVKSRYILKYTILAIALIIAWIIYFAQLTTGYFGRMVSLSFSSILSFLGQGFTQREPFRLTALPQYEIFIDKYIYIPLLLLLFIYCIYSVRKKKNLEFMPLILYGSMFFIFLPLIFTNAGKLFMYRSWSFFFIGLSFSVAIVLMNFINKNMLAKIAAFLSVILIVAGGISVGSSSSYRDPNYLEASVPSSITLDVIHASDWFGTHFGQGNTILGDLTVYTVFRGYGRQFVQTDPYLFYKETMDSESVRYLFTNFSGKFVTVDNRITEKLSSSGYYFDRKELETKDHRWGFTDPLPKQNIEKLNTYKRMYRIYDNKNINIYYIDK